MSTVPEIERAIEQLSPEELQAFRAWFVQRDAAEWDVEFERDVAAGKLEALAEEALREYRQGQCRDL